MLNLLEKLHALVVQESVRVWHYAGKADNPKFFYWLQSDIEAGKTEGYGFNTLEEMIEAAYCHINPMCKPMPVPKPPLYDGT